MQTVKRKYHENKCINYKRINKMMKRFRKIAAAMLAAVMVTGLVACGKNSSKSADGS